MMKSSLSAWIDRQQPIPERFNQVNHADIFSSDWSAWVAIEDSHPLHRASDLDWQGLESCRLETNSYLDKASSLICGLTGGWLDSEERDMILEKLGEPPNQCLPIYLVTIGRDGGERLVYVGKTTTNNRFTGGHSVALKLHAPEYTGFTKTIYRCSIWFHFDDEYISLEWINPEDLAISILDSVESQLIFDLKPELNTQKKRSQLATKPLVLHIENHSNSCFLNYKTVYY